MRRGYDPLIVALDAGDIERIRFIAEALRGEVETVKVGLEAFTAFGPAVVEELVGMGYGVFADLKLHDIPNTVRGAVKALVRLGVSMLTVHCAGGRVMLEAAVEAAEEQCEAMGLRRPLLLGVTVLTSLEDGDLEEIGWHGNAGEAVMRMAGLATDCGLDGVIASAREAAELRKRIPEGKVIVAPGIRPLGGEAQDQARTATAAQALAAGADYIVIGRPVTAQPDPLPVLRELRSSAGL